MTICIWALFVWDTGICHRTKLHFTQNIRRYQTAMVSMNATAAPATRFIMPRP